MDCCWCWFQINPVLNTHSVLKAENDDFRATPYTCKRFSLNKTRKHLRTSKFLIQISKRLALCSWIMEYSPIPTLQTKNLDISYWKKSNSFPIWIFRKIFVLAWCHSISERNIFLVYAFERISFSTSKNFYFAKNSMRHLSDSSYM